MTHDTDRAPDLEDTDPRGILTVPPAEPPDLGRRMVEGIEATLRHVKETNVKLDLLIGELRSQAARVSSLEIRMAGLPCQRGEDCPNAVAISATPAA